MRVRWKSCGYPNESSLEMVLFFLDKFPYLDGKEKCQKNECNFSINEFKNS